MDSSIDDFHRFTATNDVVEDKRALAAALQSDIERFLKQGGKVQKIATGVSKLDEELPPPSKDGKPQSGKPGITWSVKDKRWAVRTKNTRFPIGHADTIREALDLQEAFESKQRWKDGKYE